MPNLVAMPFETTFEFCKAIADKSGSQCCLEMLEGGRESFDARVSANRAEVARNLVIELLAYQFASPVQWIATQHVFFTSGVRRVIEIGPAITLTRMAMRTLQTGKYGDQVRELLYIEKDSDKVFFGLPSAGPDAKDAADASYAQLEAEAAAAKATLRDASPVNLTVPPPSARSPEPVAAARAPPASPIPAPIVQTRAVPASSGGGGGGSAADCPPTPLDAVRAIVAVKTGAKSMADVKPTDTLKALCGGQSAL